MTYVLLARGGPDDEDRLVGVYSSLERAQEVIKGSEWHPSRWPYEENVWEGYRDNHTWAIYKALVDEEFGE